MGTTNPTKCRFFICGYLGESIGWHYGFGAAGIGMAFGLVQFVLTRKNLGKIGLAPSIEIKKELRKKELTFFYLFFSLKLL